LQTCCGTPVATANEACVGFLSGVGFRFFVVIEELSSRPSSRSVFYWRR
jgi:hypothetical protein